MSSSRLQHPHTYVPSRFRAFIAVAARVVSTGNSRASVCDDLSRKGLNSSRFHRYMAVDHATAKVRSVSFRRLATLHKGRLLGHARIQLAQDRSCEYPFCRLSVKLQSVSKRFAFVREARFNHTAPAAVSESAIGKVQNL